MTTRNRIIAAADELYCRNGIRRITMDDIAQHLSVSKKTIYRYFEEKDDLVHTVCINIMHQRRNEFEEIQNHAKDAIHEIIDCMQHMSGMFSKMNPGLFYDLQKFFPRTWKSFREFKEKQMMGLIEQNLVNGIKEGLYRSEIPVRVLAKLRMEEVELAMNPAIFPPEKFEHTKLQVALLDHFLYGIVTLKGHKLIDKYKKLKEKKNRLQYAS